MNLEEQFNLDLHGGKEINGMIRHNAYYIGDAADGTQTVLFDNGNFYVLKDDVILDRMDWEDEFFIDRHLVAAIYNCIELNPLLLKDYGYSESNADDIIEFYTEIEKNEKIERGILIRLIINRESKTIDISNIMIPFELKHNGFGKKIINEVYKVAKKHAYKLYLVQMVESFYNRMIKRGAKVIAPFDVVEITENTILLK